LRKIITETQSVVYFVCNGQVIQWEWSSKLREQSTSETQASEVSF